MKKILTITNDIKTAREIRTQLLPSNIDVAIVSEEKKFEQYLFAYACDLLILQVEPALQQKLLIKFRNLGKDLPAVLLSYDKSLNFLKTAFENQADEILYFPLNMLELEARILKLFKRPPVANLDFVSYHDLQVDFENNLIFRSGIRIKLSKKENEVLRYLILNKNRLITRDRILVNIWNNKPSTKHNTVDCYVSSLRKKLDSVGKHKFLHTEHGMGYVFKV